MDSCKVLGAMLAFVTVLCLASSTQGDPVWADDFEDGVIDPSLWEWGGRQLWEVPGNDWDFSHQEIVDPTDGYLKIRVWGPTSGTSYGAEAWVRTKYDYNDGSDYVINFRWEADPNDVGSGSPRHTDVYAIQITDGTIGGGSDHWLDSDGEGWTNLFHVRPLGDDLGPVEWSIYIDGSNDMATLFEGPDNTWPMSDEGEKTLPADQAWYVRFINQDMTSGGFTAGDNLLNLYNFVPEPATLSLLLFGGIAALKRRR